MIFSTSDGAGIDGAGRVVWAKTPWHRSELVIESTAIKRIIIHFLDA